MRISATGFQGFPPPLLLLTLFALLSPSSAPAATREVCAVGCAYSTIQGAIGAAAAGDVVLVHDGTYFENIDFRGKPITVRSRNGAAATVIDGAGAGTVVQFVSGETSRSLLQGFTIAHGSGGIWAGGIRCDRSSPRVADCVIRDNSGRLGGGVRIYGGYPSFSRCEILSNAGAYGGGVSAADTAAVFTSCRIAGNTSTFGAGIGCFGSSARTEPPPPELSPRFVNCVVSGNSTVAPPGCTRYLGGGLGSSYSSPTIVNCTFGGNYADIGGGIAAFRSRVRVVNSILWNDAGGALHVGEGATINATYSDVQYGFRGQGNRDADPQFVRPVYPWNAPSTEGDLRLRRTSPCVDAGTATGAPGTDLEGQRRPWGRRVDIGADEHFGGVDVCPEGCVWTSIQEALEQAGYDEVVLVGDGVYLERLRFSGRGAVVRSLNGPAATVIDGGGGGSAVTFSTDVSSNYDELAGFTVRGGSGTAIDGLTWGGGVLVESGARAVVQGCRIAGNVADQGGGVAARIGSYLLLNTTLVTGNRASLEGGGLWLVGSGLRDVTVAGNAAGTSGGGLLAGEGTPVSARGSIFWGNAAAGLADQVAAPPADFTAAFCDIQGGGPGTMLLDADPLFVAPVAAESAPTTDGDYHIQAASPCVGAGETGRWAALPPFDLDGDPRGIEQDRDIGADEYVAPGNLVANASFEEGIPQPSRWARSLLASTDRVLQGGSHDGRGAYYLTGNRTGKRLYQSIPLAGAAGDSFTLRGWMQAPGGLASLGGFAGIRVRFLHRDGTTRTLRLPAPAAGEWSEAEMTFAATRAYRRVEVALMNSSGGASVGFDAVRLTRD